jgi:hypothetical protein
MKKTQWLILGVVVLVAGLVIALVTASFFMGDLIKKGIETAGPQVAQVDVKLAKASLSMLGGQASISGLVVGNPQGYKSDAAIKVNQASLQVVPSSLFSDKIVIKSVILQAPEITLEGSAASNNLSQIQKNIAAYLGAGGTTPKTTDHKTTPSSDKKLQVDDFLVSQAKVNALFMGKKVLLTIPDIHITGLGQGPEGITPADLSKRVLSEILNASLTDLTSKAADLGVDALKQAGKNATENLKATKSATDSLNKATKGINDLLPKKKE